MEKLSRYFRLSEFLKKEDEATTCIFCPDIEIRLLKKIITPLIKPLQFHLSSPVIILSAYRSSEFNSQTGGKPHSHHLFEADRSACDFTCPDISSAWKWLEKHRSRFCYAYWDKSRNFIHISGLTGTDRRVGVMWMV